jgi:hypothetical protein
MRKLRLMLQYWLNRHPSRPPDQYRLPAMRREFELSLDPEEFATLLRSGSKQDMRTLARKLSERPWTRA